MKRCNNPDCKNEFSPTWHRQEYCSPNCSAHARYLRNVKPKQRIRYTGKRLTDKQIAANIERIYQREAARGTLGWSTLAPRREG